MKTILRTSLLSAAALLLAGVARAQDDLARIQAGDEVTAPAVEHHASSPVPQFDPSSFPGQLFWLAISFALLYVLMSRLVLPRIGIVIENREAQIARDLGQAQQDRTLAGELLAAHERALAETRSNAQAAVAAAQADAARAQTAELGTQGTRLAALLAGAETRIAASRTAALAELAPATASATQAIIARLTSTDVDSARATAEVTKALSSRNAA